MEVRATVREQADRLAVDGSVVDLKALERRDDRGEGVGPIPAGSRPQANPITSAAGDDAIAVPF